MEGFWQNISRYPRYFVTISLGVFLNAIAPLVPLFKRPTTAVALVGILISALVFTALTLRAMLGLTPV
jgi:sensor histidine kinase regulating citrate/malate metabolism